MKTQKVENSTAGRGNTDFYRRGSTKWRCLVVCVYCTCASVRGCTSCMQPVDVRLHNDSWCSCSGGLRSWERHEAVTRRCVPLGAPDAAIALRLGQPGSSSVLSQLCRSSAGSSTEVRIAEPSESSGGIPEELFSTLSQRHWRNSGGNTSDFLCYCSQHPTFLLQPPRPTTNTHTHTKTHASSPHPTPLTHCFCIPFFPGSN